MKRYVFPVLMLFLLIAACDSDKKEMDVVGKYRSHTQWGGNDIYIDLRNDSAYTFTAYTEKSMIFCSAGKWSVQDSFVMLKGFEQYDFPAYFPDLKEVPHVTPIVMEAKFIARDEKLYNMIDGKANEEQYYDKISASK